MVRLEYSVEEPLNREPDLEKLVSNFITQEGYDRNHGPIPHLDAATHSVSVQGLVKRDLSLMMDDLKALPQHSVICALQCAGNRRHTMRTKLKEVSGIDWFDGAVMNCKWTGPLVKDVLEKVGIDISPERYHDAHVAFACHQTACQDDDWYGASVPLTKVLDPSSSIILALTMNDKPLTPNHGAPVRVVTPGIAGARSVKWLDSIIVQMAESANYYQQHDYKILPPEAENAEKAEKWWSKVPAIQEMPINSVVGFPKPHSKVERDENGCIEVKGYALPSGADGPVQRVEVSIDGGETWTDAELLGAHEADEPAAREPAAKGDQAVGAEGRLTLKWAWCLWRANVKIDKGTDKSVLSRATDAAGNTQSKCPEWNLRGVAYNGYGEVTGLHVI